MDFLHAYGRKAVSTVNGKKVMMSIGAGCPQGGVLSPFLWDCVVDELLVTLREQKALDITKEWCDRVELSVNASKTEAIVFTLKRKLDCPPLLRYGGVEIPFCSTVRYLGITLDQKLTWGPHCEARSRKLCTAFAQCKRAVSTKWGISPRLVKWIYVAVVRPALIYGSVGWVTAVDKICNVGCLEKVQRMALLYITGALSTTPTKALESLMGILPIMVQVRAAALTQCTGWNRMGPGRTREIVVTSQEETTKEWEERGPPNHGIDNVVCYTDGSRHDGRTGAAAIIAWGGEQTALSIPLGTSATVFQAEVLAICWAAKEMSGIPDSKSALQALETWNYMTTLVGECFMALKTLASNHRLELIWIPAHHGYFGNEQVDELAKEAADMVIFGPEPIVPVAMTAVRHAIKSKALDEHNAVWHRYSGARQTKELINVPAQRVITGHSTLRAHLHKIGRADSDICPFCLLEKETSLHFLVMIGSVFRAKNNLKILGNLRRLVNPTLKCVSRNAICVFNFHIKKAEILDRDSLFDSPGGTC
ncbi:hypothetical protein Ocin01_19403, partial [Orchesella cincta]